MYISIKTIKYLLVFQFVTILPSLIVSIDMFLKFGNYPNGVDYAENSFLFPLRNIITLFIMFNFFFSPSLFFVIIWFIIKKFRDKAELKQLILMLLYILSIIIVQIFMMKYVVAWLMD